MTWIAALAVRGILAGDKVFRFLLVVSARFAWILSCCGERAGTEFSGFFWSGVKVLEYGAEIGFLDRVWGQGPRIETRE